MKGCMNLIKENRIPFYFILLYLSYLLVTPLHNISSRLPFASNNSKIKEISASFAYLKHIGGGWIVGGVALFLPRVFK